MFISVYMYVHLLVCIHVRLTDKQTDTDILAIGQEYRHTLHAGRQTYRWTDRQTGTLQTGREISRNTKEKRQSYRQTKMQQTQKSS